jgi:hypothetical protein
MEFGLDGKVKGLGKSQLSVEMGEVERKRVEGMMERWKFEEKVKGGIVRGVEDENVGRICKDKNGKGIWYSRNSRRK